MHWSLHHGHARIKNQLLARRHQLLARYYDELDRSNEELDTIAIENVDKASELGTCASSRSSVMRMPLRSAGS